MEEIQIPEMWAGFVGFLASQEMAWVNAEVTQDPQGLRRRWMPFLKVTEVQWGQAEMNMFDSQIGWKTNQYKANALLYSTLWNQ